MRLGSLPTCTHTQYYAYICIFMCIMCKYGVYVCVSVYACICSSMLVQHLVYTGARLRVFSADPLRAYYLCSIYIYILYTHVGNLYIRI